MKRNNFTDPENYLFLEAAHRGNHDWPDLYIGLHRLNYSPEVEQAAQDLDLTLENTKQEKDGSDYIGNIINRQAFQLARALRGATPPLIIFADFLKTLRDGAQGKIKAYNGNKSQINAERLENIYNEIVEARSPWRAEHLDGAFDSKNKHFINYYIFDAQGNMEEVKEELDPDTLMKDKLPGISLDNWLNNQTPQGFPRRKIQEGTLHYWHPQRRRIILFGTGSNGSVLYCVRGPSVGYPSIGLRFLTTKLPAGDKQ